MKKITKNHKKKTKQKKKISGTVIPLWFFYEDFGHQYLMVYNLGS